MINRVFKIGIGGPKAFKSFANSHVFRMFNNNFFF